MDHKNESGIRIYDEKQLYSEFPVVYNHVMPLHDISTVIVFKQFFIVGGRLKGNTEPRAYMYSYHPGSALHSYGTEEISIFETDLRVNFNERVSALCAQTVCTSQYLIDATKDLFIQCNERIEQCINILKSHGIVCAITRAYSFADYINAYFSEANPIHHSIFNKPLNVYFALPCRIDPIYLRRHVADYLRRVSRNISAVCDIHTSNILTAAGTVRGNVLDNATFIEYHCVYDHRNYGYLIEYLLYPTDGESNLERLLSRITTERYLFCRTELSLITKIFRKSGIAGLERLRYALLWKMMLMGFLLAGLGISYIFKKSIDTSDVILFVFAYAAIVFVILYDLYHYAKTRLSMYPGKRPFMYCEWLFTCMRDFMFAPQDSDECVDCNFGYAEIQA